MVTRVYYPVILPDQFFAAVFGDLAELVVNESDNAALVGDGDDRGFVEGKL